MYFYKLCNYNFYVFERGHVDQVYASRTFLSVVCSNLQGMSTEFFLFMFHSGGGRLYKPWPATPGVVLLAGYHFMLTSSCIYLFSLVSLTYLNDFGCS